MSDIASIVIDGNPLTTTTVDSIAITLLPSKKPSWEENSYSHEIRVMGGFWKCNFTVIGAENLLYALVRKGLSDRVRSFLPDGRLAWEGYINSMTLIGRGLNYTVSLEDMGNRVWVRYVDGPANLKPGPTIQKYDAEAIARMEADLVGGSAVTRSTKYNDTTSQGKYGIKEVVLAGGDMPTTVANNSAQAYLNLVSNPTRGAYDFISNQKHQNLKLKISCNGYWHTMDWLTFNKTIGSGSGTVRTDILVPDHLVPDCGQFIASSDIEIDQEIRVNEVFDADRTAGSLLLDVARLGDGNGKRYVTGILDDRQFYYYLADVEDQGNVTYLSDPRDPGRLLHVTGRQIRPAEIRPDKWVRNGYLMANQEDGASSLFDDVQAQYIESVVYQEPNDFRIFGSRGGFVDVLIAKMSIGGVSFH